jgi:hypothetical protein
MTTPNTQDQYWPETSKNPDKAPPKPNSKITPGTVIAGTVLGIALAAGTLAAVESSQAPAPVIASSPGTSAPGPESPNIGPNNLNITPPFTEEPPVTIPNSSKPAEGQVNPPSG